MELVKLSALCVACLVPVLLLRRKTPEQALLLTIAILAVALAGGGAVYFLKFKKKKPDTKGSADLDDYDYGDEDEYSDAGDEPEDGEDE